MTLQLIPAIDISDGNCVRLFQGDFSQVTTYHEDPLRLAAEYASQGASLLHVVDLDGAQRGRSVNTTLIRCMTDVIDIQTGGGLRNTHDLRALFENGVSRAVIGSIAVTDPELTLSLLEEFGAERVVLAVDGRFRDGVFAVNTHGWSVATDLSATDVLANYAGHGLRHVLVTDIDRDGALAGPNLDLYRSLAGAFPQLSIQASGGVRDLADLRALAQCGVAAAISGKALLEQRIKIEEMLPFLQSA